MSVLAMFLIGFGAIIFGVLVCIFRKRMFKFFSILLETMGDAGKAFVERGDPSDLLYPAIGAILIGGGFVLSGVLRVMSGY